MVQWLEKKPRRACHGSTSILFIIVMTIGSQNIDMHFIVNDFIDKTMFACNATAPLPGTIT